MYQFLKGLIPTRANERKKQEMADDLNDAVHEAKSDVSNVQDIEFELSLAMNRTSTTIDKLEAERDEQLKRVELMEKTLTDLSKYELNETQKHRRDNLERQLNEVVKKSLEETEKEIDDLTRKLLILNNKRDAIAQRKVSTQDGIDGAVTLPYSSSSNVRMDSLDGEQMVGADQEKNETSTTTTDQTNNNEYEDVTNSLSDTSSNITNNPDNV